eukprot:1193806-Prorocentrum_minimum.AAC.1
MHRQREIGSETGLSPTLKFELETDSLAREAFFQTLLHGLKKAIKLIERGCRATCVQLRTTDQTRLRRDSNSIALQ